MLKTPRTPKNNCDAPTAGERLSISADDATEFLRLHALLSTIQEQIEPLRAKILAAIIGGANSPAHLPLLLVNRPQARKQADWKGACREAYRRLFKSPKRADAKIEQLDAAWKCKEIPSLVVVPNPSYILEAH